MPTKRLHPQASARLSVRYVFLLIPYVMMDMWGKIVGHLYYLLSAISRDPRQFPQIPTIYVNVPICSIGILYTVSNKVVGKTKRTPKGS